MPLMKNGRYCSIEIETLGLIRMRPRRRSTLIDSTSPSRRQTRSIHQPLAERSCLNLSSARRFRTEIRFTKDPDRQHVTTGQTIVRYVFPPKLGYRYSPNHYCSYRAWMKVMDVAHDATTRTATQATINRQQLTQYRCTQ